MQLPFQQARSGSSTSDADGISLVWMPSPVFSKLQKFLFPLVAIGIFVTIVGGFCFGPGVSLEERLCIWLLFLLLWLNIWPEAISGRKCLFWLAFGGLVLSWWGRPNSRWAKCGCKIRSPASSSHWVPNTQETSPEECHCLAHWLLFSQDPSPGHAWHFPQFKWVFPPPTNVDNLSQVSWRVLSLWI